MGKAFSIVFLICIMLAGTAVRSCSAENVTLTVAAIKMHIEAPLEPMIEAYKKENPHVTVNFIQLPNSDNGTEIHQWLVQNLSSTAGDVDIASADGIWFSEFASAGWLLDVGPYYTEEELAEHFKGAVQTVSHKGTMYGVPWWIDGGLLLYRTDLLEKYGIAPPRTWDELIAGAEKVVKGENDLRFKGFVFQAKQAEVLVCNLIEFLGSKGAVLDADGNVVINNEYGRRAAHLMHDLIFKYKISPPEVNTFAEESSRITFTDGTAVFMRNWPYVWNPSQNPEQSSVVGKVGILPMPAFKDAGSAACLGGWQWAINKGTKHPEEAVKLAKFLGNYDSQKYFAIHHACIPTRPSVFEDPELRASQPYIAGLQEVFVGATPRPITPLYPEVSLALQASFSKICSTEDIDVDQELDRLAEELETIVTMLD